MRIILIILLTLGHSIQEKKISDLNVLFPALLHQDSRDIHHSITAFGGCYTWRITKPNIIDTRPISNQQQKQCTNTAILMLKYRGDYPGIINIVARDINTDQQIKVEARIGILNRIQILTKFRVMHVNDVQELAVIGFDKQGNSISSLQGLTFQWSIQDNTILQVIPIKFSSLKTTQYRGYIQQKGHQTDIIFIKGRSTGKVNIRVHVKEWHYRQIQASATVRVFQNFFMRPDGIIYMIPQSKLQFDLYLEGQNGLWSQKKIIMPNAFYRKQISQDFQITPSLYLTAPSKSVTSKLIIYDKRTNDLNYVEARIQVLQPSSIVINYPEYPIIGYVYPLSARVFNGSQELSGQRKIDFQVGKNMRLDLVDENVSAYCRNNAKTYIRATLSPNLITTQKPIHPLTPLISISPSPIYLPLQQQYYIKIIGSKGHYKYYVHPQSLGKIDNDGKFVGKQYGKGNIQVIDRYNQQNKIRVQVHVSKLGKYQSVQQMKQVLVDQYATFQYGLRNDKGMFFSNCSGIRSSLSIHSHISSTVNNRYQHLISLLNDYPQDLLDSLLQRKFYKSRKQIANKFQLYLELGEIKEQELYKMIKHYENYGICGSFQIRGKKFGYVDAQITGEGKEDDVRIKVYQPLQSAHQHTLLLSPGSSYMWRLNNGPTPWDTKPLLYNVTFESYNSLVQFPYQIICPKKLQQTLYYKVTVSNQKSKFLLRPLEMVNTLKVLCQVPRSLQIYLVKQGKQNLKEYHVNKYYPPSKRTFMQPLLFPPKSQSNLLIWAFDQTQKPFDNISSLEFQWQLQPYQIGKYKNILQESLGYMYDLMVVMGIGKNIGKKVIWGKGKGQVIVYTKKVKYQFGGMEFQKVKDTLSVELKQPFIPPRQSKLMFPSTQNKPIIPLDKGSGFFTIQLNDSSLLTYNYDDKLKQLSYCPLNPGVAKFTITDSRMQNIKKQQIIIRIGQVNKVVIQGSGIIRAGQSKQIKVSVYDPYGQQFSLQQYKFMNIQFITNLRDQTYRITTTSIPNQFLFTSTTKNDYKIQANIHNKYFSETPITIQVYQPLEVWIGTEGKQEIVLGLQCNTSVIIKGGPKQGRNVELKIRQSSNWVVQLQQISKKFYSIVGTKQGTTFLTFTLTYQQKVLQEKIIKITVGQITSLHLPYSRTVHSQAQIRFLVQLQIDNTKLSYSMCPYKFTYKSSDQSVLYVHQREQGDIGTNITVNGKGTGVIQVVVSKDGKQINNGKVFYRVVDPINLQYPTYIQYQNTRSNHLLLPPDIEYVVPSNAKFPCPSNVLTSSQSTIRTSREKGFSTFELKDSSSTVLVNVQVKNIFGIFIENEGTIEMQNNGQGKVRFWIQQQSGRLFPNDIIGIDYIVKVTNQRVLQAYVSSNKNYIVLKAKSPGTSILILTLSTNPSIYDIVVVRIGSLLQPTSPVYVHNGGEVMFTFKGKRADGKWRAQSNNLQIDSRGRCKSKGLGSGIIIYEDGIKYKSKVNIFQIDTIQSVQQPVYLTNLQSHNSYSSHYKFQFKGFHKQSQYQIKKLSDTQSINHNLRFGCRVDSEAFEVVQYIEDKIDYDKLFCLVAVKQGNFRKPTQLVLFASFYTISSSQLVVEKRFTFDFHWKFQIPKASQKVQLSKSTSQKYIEITTQVPLTVIPSKQLQQFVSSSHDYQNGITKILIKKKDNSLVSGYIEIINNKIYQKERIEVQINGSSSSSQLWLDIQWVDWVIILISVFLIYLVSQNLLFQSSK